MDQIRISNIDYSQRAEFIIDQVSGKWLAERLKISYPTLKKRIHDRQWNIWQCDKISEIYHFLK